MCEACGAGGACCKLGWNEDPPECVGATGYVDHQMTHATAYDYHQCVNAGPGLSPALDCWQFCKGKAGPCGSCGVSGYCLHESMAFDEPSPAPQVRETLLL